MKKKIIFLVTALSVSSSWFTACTPIRAEHSGTSDIQSALNEGITVDSAMAAHTQVADRVNNELMPQADLNVPQLKDTDKRFNVSVQNLPAAKFFTGLSQGTPYSIVVSPKVTGNISLDLKNVNIEDVLKAVRDTYGYDFERTSYGYNVLPSGLQTRVFSVNYLDIKRQGETETLVNGGQPTYTSTTGLQSSITGTDANGTPTPAPIPTGPVATSSGIISSGNGGQSQPVVASSEIDTSTKSDFWPTLKTTLKAMVPEGDGRSVVVDSQAGVVVVKAYANEMKQVAQYLSVTENSVNRQVILEAKIIEVTLSRQYETGINWQILGMTVGQDITRNGEITDSNGFTFVNPSTGESQTSNFTLYGRKGDVFKMLIKALSLQGQVQVLSSPNVSTLNNQKAVLKAGTDQYFVTSISNSTIAGGGSTDATQNIQITPFFSGVSLDVTPQINSNDDVILHVHPSVSRVINSELTVTIGTGTGTAANNQTTIPSAKSDIRETDTVVRARNGEVIVIGGLMQTNEGEQIQGVPFLEKLPFWGSLFRNTYQRSEKTELVILLRPTVVGPGAWADRLQTSANNVQNLNKGYHFGSHPCTFGNMAEFPCQQP